MTSPDPLVGQLVTRLQNLGFGAPPAVGDASITLEKLAPEVRNLLGSGGGGVSLVEDPPGSGLFIASSSLVENPPGSGLFDTGV